MEERRGGGRGSKRGRVEELDNFGSLMMVGVGERRVGRSRKRKGHEMLLAISKVPSTL